MPYLFFSQMLRTNFKDNVDKVKPITGTSELSQILLIFEISQE